MSADENPGGWRSQVPHVIRAGQAAAAALAAIWGRLCPWLSKAARLVRPEFLGAIYILALTFAAAPAQLIDATERALGQNTAHIESYVQRQFASTILGFAITVVVTALVVGVLLGVLASAVLRLRAWVREVPVRTSVSYSAYGFVVVVLIHVSITVHAMAWRPQLYASAFYEKGGVRRTIQEFLTHSLGAQSTTWILIALWTLFVAPPWSWRSVVARAVRRVRSWPRWAPIVAVCGVSILIVAMVAQPSVRSRRASQSQPNVLILGADSFREEALNARVMPRLHALGVQRGARFSNAYVSMARTLSSWLTFLTGRDAHHHGVRSMFPRWEEHAHDLDTLPSHLVKQGYRTSLVSDYGGDVLSNMNIGFEKTLAPRLNAPELIRSKGFARTWPILPFVDTRLGRVIFPTMRDIRECANASILADDAIEELHRLREEPFFLTVFFGASHAPYAAPAPYYRRFSLPNYDRRNKYHKSAWISPDDVIDAEEIEHVYGLYEGTLSSVDEAAGRILDELDRLGLTDNTIIVIMGDHGENMADAPGRYYGHGNHLFGDHDLHVPLVIVDPRHPTPRVESGVVTNSDFSPTLYSLLGVSPPGDLDGISLVPALEGHSVLPRPTFAETELWIGLQKDLSDELRFPLPDIMEFSEVDGEHGDMLVLRPEFVPLSLVARHRMVRDSNRKLLYIPTLHGVVYKLFDTAQDPENLVDLAGSEPEAVDRLKAILWKWMLADPAMEERHGYLVPKGVTIPGVDTPFRPSP